MNDPTKRASFVAVTSRASWTVVCAILLGCAACGHGGAKATNGTGSGTGTGTGSGTDVVVVEAVPDAGVEDVGSGTGTGTAVVENDDPLPAPKLELVDTVETTETRADMSASLIKPAEKADADGKRALAIVYYQALRVARGPNSPEARRLAELWALAGQPDEAVRVFDELIAAATDLAKMRELKAARDKIAGVRAVYSTRIELPSLDKEAETIFKKGRAAYKKKQYGDALVYFQMGYALAPDLAGFLRELGATYKELKADDKRLEFYTRYLRLRPFGSNADDIRKELAKEKGVLGALTVTTSLPCESVILINRQPMPPKQIDKAFKVAPGTYVGLCISEKYEFGMWARAEVTADATATLAFKWALVENQLKKPFGRIRIENPEEPGVMMDLGISSDVLGVQVPDDGRGLQYTATSDDGSKTKSDFIKLTAGQRHEIKW